LSLAWCHEGGCVFKGLTTIKKEEPTKKRMQDLEGGKKRGRIIKLRVDGKRGGKRKNGFQQRAPDGGMTFA